MGRASTKENKNKYQLIPVGLLVAASHTIELPS